MTIWIERNDDGSVVLAYDKGLSWDASLSYDQLIASGTTWTRASLAQPSAIWTGTNDDGSVIVAFDGGLAWDNPALRFDQGIASNTIWTQDDN